jgi:hypothetical protein
MRGNSPTWTMELGCAPVLPYIKKGMLPFLTQKNKGNFPQNSEELFSLFLSLMCGSQSLEPALGVRGFSTIRTPSCCWTPGPDLSSSAASAGSEPGGHGIHRMCASTTRCCTCGTRHRWSVYTAMRSSWAYVFTDNVPTGT